MGTNNVNNDIVDVSLSGARKKKIRIDGDDNRILELNTSDLNLIVRLREVYPQLTSLSNDAFSNWTEKEISDSENTDFMSNPTVSKITELLKETDAKMRELIDYIFDSNVSEVCAPSGSMYDPVGGKLRYEHIVDCLSSLYEKDISTEMKKISKRVQKHTDKYTHK